jgi:ATP-binding cassette, subfamily F, member 3
MLFRLDNIEKSYGGNEILRGVSFQINPFEKVGLVGRNGAGKTTVFKIIAGQETADEGEMVKVNTLSLGLLEQNVAFNDSETVHTSALSAFQRIHDIEAEMRRLEKTMETDHSEEILTAYADLMTEFEAADGFTYTARAETILLGMGFTQETWNTETKLLSGGQKNRLGMVRLLLSQPDILLLDEPTNHIDVEAVEWLENFLLTYPSGYVIISHDRYFLDKTANRIIEMEQGKAIVYKGNYSEYLVEREERREQQRREFENQQAYIAKTEDFIRRNLEGQKTKQAKSRRTLLAKMDRIESVAADKSSGNFNLKTVERAGTNVLMVENLSVGYGDKVLAKKIEFTLHRGECLGVIGGNGTGKTTFLRTILGQIRELSGEMIWGTKVETGYYSQKLEDLDERNEVIGELRRVAPMATNGELRGFLARFLFTDDDVFKRVGTLSGGEKGRLALAKLIYSKVNVLILDEPTNHLDIPSREALEAALQSYGGTVIVVSHDRYFLDQVCTQMLEIKQDKSVEFHNGNYSEYLEWRAKNNKPARKETAKEIIVEVETPKIEEAKPLNNLSKNQRQTIEKRIAEIEKTIPKLEDELSKISNEMALPEVAANHGKLADTSAKFDLKQAEIQKMYAEWETLSEELK